MPVYTVTWTETVLMEATIEAADPQQVREILYEGQVDGCVIDQLDASNFDIREEE